MTNWRARAEAAEASLAAVRADAAAALRALELRQYGTVERDLAAIARDADRSASASVSA